MVFSCQYQPRRGALIDVSICTHSTNTMRTLLRLHADKDFALARWNLQMLNVAGVYRQACMGEASGTRRFPVAVHSMHVPMEALAPSLSETQARRPQYQASPLRS